jgi:hypothetical protein
MTKDEIIEMAKQAGWKDMKDYDSEMNESFFIGKFTDLKTFAKLVAQHEREACAKLCEELRDDWFRGLGRYEFMGEGADYCSDAIRARGQK